MLSREVAKVRVRCGVSGGVGEEEEEGEAGGRWGMRKSKSAGDQGREFGGGAIVAVDGRREAEGSVRRQELRGKFGMRGPEGMHVPGSDMRFSSPRNPAVGGR